MFVDVVKAKVPISYNNMQLLAREPCENCNI